MFVSRSVEHSLTFKGHRARCTVCVVETEIPKATQARNELIRAKTIGSLIKKEVAKSFKAKHINTIANTKAAFLPSATAPKIITFTDDCSKSLQYKKKTLYYKRN